MNKFESSSIQKQVKESYKATFPDQGNIILGVSGGPDSMALLYLLHKNEIPIFVVHINYGIRGEESDADQYLVEEVCAMWNIDCCSVSLKDEKVTGNFQEWARDKRYQIFRDLMREIGAIGIAVAHHADDQLETILFKILRGGGVSSWKGLQVWDGQVFRPMLNLSKAEILEFCEIEAIPYRIDTSNNSNKYTRNAFRNQIFPVFDQFIPGWNSNLKSIGEKAEITDELLGVFLKTIVEGESLLIEKLTDFSPGLKASLIKQFIQNYADYNPTKGEILSAVELMFSQTGREISLNEEIRVIKNRDRLTLKKITQRREVDVSLTQKEIEKDSTFGGWKFKKRSVSQVSALNLSMAQIQWPLNIRLWKEGDTFHPLGLGGSQKVSDHLTNRKINATLREDSLILIDSGGTICAILYPELAINGEHGCISELVKITQSTKNVLSISKT